MKRFQFPDDDDGEPADDVTDDEYAALMAGIRFGKASDDSWQWIDGGTFELEHGTVEIRLRDRTGWWSR